MIEQLLNARLFFITYDTSCNNSKKPVKTNTINLAEFGTYSLEFTRLSQITKDNSYAKIANKLIENAISNPSVMPGLYPTHWDISGETMKPIKSSEFVTQIWIALCYG